VFDGQSYAGTDTCTTCYGATGEQASDILLPNNVVDTSIFDSGGVV